MILKGFGRGPDLYLDSTTPTLKARKHKERDELYRYVQVLVAKMNRLCVHFDNLGI